MSDFKRYRYLSDFLYIICIFNFLSSVFLVHGIFFIFDVNLNIVIRYLIVVLIDILPSSLLFLFNVMYVSNRIIMDENGITVVKPNKKYTYKWNDISNFNIGFLTVLMFDKEKIMFSTNTTNRKFICNKLNVEYRKKGSPLFIIVSLPIIIFSLTIGIYYLHKICTFESNIEDIIPWENSITNVTKEEYSSNITTSKKLTNKLSLFPNSVDCNVDYYNSYIEVTGKRNYFIQETYLKYKYNDLEFFNKEIYRLNNLEIYNVKSNTSKKCLYIENMFDFPVYISIYNYDKCYEYALVDEMNLTIHYIHINNNKDFYIFDEIYRPTKKLIYYYEHLLYSMYE